MQSNPVIQYHEAALPARLAAGELNQRLKDLLQLKCPSCLKDLIVQGHKFLKEAQGEALLHGVFYLATAYELYSTLNIQEYKFDHQPLDQYLDTLEKSLKEGENLLHYFAAQENLSIFGYLFSERPSIKSQLNDLAGEVIKETPLHVAIRMGSISIAQFLQEQGADIKKVGDGQYAKTVLHVAVEYGQEEIVDLLLKHKDIPEILNASQGEKGYTALHLAAAKGHFAILLKLINCGAHTELQDVFHLTPLEVLLERESLDFKMQDKCACILLSKKGPSFFQLDNPSLKICFRNVLKHGLLNIAKKLAANGLPQPEEQECSFLEIAAEGAFPQTDAHPKGIFQEKHTAYIKLIYWLLREKRMDPNQKFKSRSDFLIHQICYAGCSELLSLFIELKADLKILDSSQNNALHYACRSPTDCADIVRILMGYDPAFVEAKNSDERLPLHLAAMTGNEKSVQCLLRQPPNQIQLDQQDKNGNTPLHLAVMAGGVASPKAKVHYCQIIAALVEKGANTNTLNKEKKTALELALKNGNDVLIQALVQAIQNPQYVANSLRNLYLSQETLSIFRIKAQQDWEFRVPLEEIYVRLEIIETQERKTRDQALDKHSDYIHDERIPIGIIETQERKARDQALDKHSDYIHDERIPIGIIETQERKACDQAINEYSYYSYFYDKHSDYIYDERIPSFETVLEPEKSIEIEQLFEHKSLKKEKAKRIYIQGAAGIGKSTLCHYIAYRWAKKDLWQGLFSYLFWIPLRNFTLGKYPANQDYTPADLIAREYAGKIEHRAIEACLNDTTFREKTLLVLDGYDELSSDAQANTSLAKAFNELKELFPHILITSRPGSCSFKRSCELELLGFDKKRIDHYIDRFFTQVQAEEKKAKLHRLLKSSPQVLSLAHTPINLTLLCCLFNEDPEFFDANQPITMTAIYERMVNWMHKWFMLRRIDQGHSTQKKEDILRWKNLRDNGEVKEIAAAFEDMAFFAMEKDTLYLEKGEIEEFIGNAAITSNELIDCGLMRIPEEKGYFIHLTLQEFLTASKFANQYLKGERKACQKFVQGCKFEPRYALVLRMIAGCLSLAISSNRRYSDSNPLQPFFDDLFAAPQDFTVRSELHLIAGCFEECQNPSIVKQYGGFIELAKDYIIHLSCLGLDYGRLLRNKNLLNHPQVKCAIGKLLSDPQDRENMLRNLLEIIRTGQTLAPEIMKFIVRILKKPDRGFAAFDVLEEVVKQGGELSEKALDTLISLLKKGGFDAPSSAARAARALGKVVHQGGEFAEKAVTALIRILEEGKPVAYHLAEVAKQEGKLAEKALAALIQLLEKGDFNAKCSAANALKEVAKRGGALPEKALAALIQLLEKGDFNAKCSAANALEEVAKRGGELPEKALAVLIQLFEEGDSNAKCSAANALGEVTKQGGKFAEKAVAALIQVLQEEGGFAAKCSAANALGEVAKQGGKFAEKAVTALIQSLQKEGDFAAKCPAPNALGEVAKQGGKFAAKAVTALIQVLQEEGGFAAKCSAANALGEVAKQGGKFAEKAVTALIQVLQEEGGFAVKCPAANALGEVAKQGGKFAEKAVTALIRILEEGKPVAYHLAEVAKQEGKLAEKALAALIQVLHEELEKDDYEIICSVVNALGRVAEQGGGLSEKALAALIQVLQDEVEFMARLLDANVPLEKDDYEIIRSAVNALKRVAGQGRELPKKALAVLIQILQEEVEFMARLPDANVPPEKYDYEIICSSVSTLGEAVKRGGELPEKVLAALIQVLQEEGEFMARLLDANVPLEKGDYEIIRSAVNALERMTKRGGELPEKALAALIQILEEGDSNAKCSAVNALGEVAKRGGELSKKALAALIQLLEEGDFSAKCSAANALGEVAKRGGGLPEKALAALIQLLEKGDSNANCSAANALKEVAKRGGELPEKALAALIQLVEKGDSNAKCSAANALKEVAKRGGELPEKALAALIQLVEKGDFSAKCSAANALGEVAKRGGGFPEKALAALIQLVEEGDSNAKCSAVNALGEVAKRGEGLPEKALAALVQILQEEGYFAAKCSAANALKEVAKRGGELPEKALAALIQLVEKGDSNAKCSAANALGEVAKRGGELAEKALAALIQLVEKGDSNAKCSAVNALGEVAKRGGELSKKALAALVQILQEEGYFAAKCSAANALKEVAKRGGELPEKALAALVQILQEEGYFAAKCSAANALGEVAKRGGELAEKALAALIQILEEGDSDAKKYAIDALKEVAKRGGELSEKAQAALIQLVEKGDSNAKCSAANALGEVAKQEGKLAEKALAALIQLVEKGDPNAKCSAANALGEVAKRGGELPEKALAALIQLVEKGDSNAKCSAANALGEVAKRGGELSKKALAALIQVPQKESRSSIRFASLSAIKDIAQRGGKLLEKTLAEIIHILLGQEGYVRYDYDKRHAADALKEINKKALLKMRVEAFPLIAMACFLTEDGFSVKGQQLQISDNITTYLSEDRLMFSYEEIREKLPTELAVWRKRLDSLSSTESSQGTTDRL
ncbi:HEAT repeat domain-containing protein [Parachlamydia sp. AcF125]|uniref:HEAT repeat domain-containing protein n=1 Tax=Parachlamydia sp. AcF125 TaxID=2795736 RepID=UPI001BC94821|nr:HEAT repeat domain-containing protein [Parachlamydia sp. AcF125]MBS4168269.1 hypothetical protein [Parachlamydia sp. AcF125]